MLCHKNVLTFDVPNDHLLIGLADFHMYYIKTMIGVNFLISYVKNSWQDGKFLEN